MPYFYIGNRLVGDDAPTYFIADISANHDGDLERAKTLIHLAKEAGADAAKFQNFRASKIVSKYGFESMQDQLSHQSKWKKSVYQVYQEASLPFEWTQALKRECDKVGIHYFSTPYDYDAADMLDPYVEVFKVGSGDITWPLMLQHIASKGKPVIVACGASSTDDVVRAVNVIRDSQNDFVQSPGLALLQCNTNYTASLENFKHIHLNVLTTFKQMFPDVVLGLSDHTPGHATALGAIALGGRIIEKHFTDDTKREGPDHPFSMTPKTWREMVDRARELEYALGSSIKQIAANERDTIVVQRRCLRVTRDLAAGDVIGEADIEALRPAPLDGIFPYQQEDVIGKTLRVDLPAGEHLRWTMLAE